MPANEAHDPLDTTRLPSTNKSVLAYRMRPPPPRPRLTLRQVGPLLITGVVIATVMMIHDAAVPKGRLGSFNVAMAVVVLSAIQSLAHGISEFAHREGDWHRRWQGFLYWLPWAFAPCALVTAISSRDSEGSLFAAGIWIAGGTAGLLALLTMQSDSVEKLK